MKTFLKYLGWWFIIALTIVAANLMIPQRVELRLHIEGTQPTTCTPRAIPPKSNPLRNA